MHKTNNFTSGHSKDKIKTYVDKLNNRSKLWKQYMQSENKDKFDKSGLFHNLTTPHPKLPPYGLSKQAFTTTSGYKHSIGLKDNIPYVFGQTSHLLAPYTIKFTLETDSILPITFGLGINDQAAHCNQSIGKEDGTIDTLGTIIIIGRKWENINNTYLVNKENMVKTDKICTNSTIFSFQERECGKIQYSLNDEPYTNCGVEFKGTLRSLFVYFWTDGETKEENIFNVNLINII